MAGKMFQHSLIILLHNLWSSKKSNTSFRGHIIRRKIHWPLHTLKAFLWDTLSTWNALSHENQIKIEIKDASTGAINTTCLCYPTSAILCCKQVSHTHPLHCTILLLKTTISTACSHYCHIELPPFTHTKTDHFKNACSCVASLNFVVVRLSTRPVIFISTSLLNNTRISKDFTTFVMWEFHESCTSKCIKSKSMQLVGWFPWRLPLAYPILVPQILLDIAIITDVHASPDDSSCT